MHDAGATQSGGGSSSHSSTYVYGAGKAGAAYDARQRCGNGQAQDESDPGAGTGKQDDSPTSAGDTPASDERFWSGAEADRVHQQPVSCTESSERGRADYQDPVAKAFGFDRIFLHPPFS